MLLKIQNGMLNSDALHTGSMNVDDLDTAKKSVVEVGVNRAHNSDAPLSTEILSLSSKFFDEALMLVKSLILMMRILRLPLMMLRLISEAFLPFPPPHLRQSILFQRRVRASWLMPFLLLFLMEMQLSLNIMKKRTLPLTTAMMSPQWISRALLGSAKLPLLIQSQCLFVVPELRTIN